MLKPWVVGETRDSPNLVLNNIMKIQCVWQIENQFQRNTSLKGGSIFLYLDSFQNPLILIKYMGCIPPDRI